MPTDEDITFTDVAVVLSRENVSLGYMGGEVPGSPASIGNDLIGGDVIDPPISSKRLMDAVKSDGDLAAVCAAAADGAAGSEYRIVPRAVIQDQEFDQDDPKSWPAEAREQHDKVQVFVQTGFHGNGAVSLRQGFGEQEHDRIVLGWSGIVVFRGTSTIEGMPPQTKALGRFHACRAKFTRPDATTTLVPIPVSLIDGRIVWVEEPRRFRRIVYEGSDGRRTFYKQFGDWRALDSRTGLYAKNSQRVPIPLTPGMPATYHPGTLPDGVEPALEVMHWATSFPDADPYGRSAWHSELTSVDVAAESASLLLDYFKSGLHSVILAAANRPFDGESASAAIKKIDELGRGRKGMGSLITLALVPSDSSSPNLSPAGLFGAADTADRGRLVLHELNTRIPDGLISGTVRAATAKSYAHAERIPAIILGRSDAYNFATATAAWEVVNRLRFAPHHEAKNTFLSRFLIEMGVTFWTINVMPSDWAEDAPLTGVASIAGQNAGMTPNDALRMLSKATGVTFDPFDEWWGEIPMPILTLVFGSPDPAAALRALGLEEAAGAFKETDRAGFARSVASKADEMDAAADAATGGGEDADQHEDGASP